MIYTVFALSPVVPVAWEAAEYLEKSPDEESNESDEGDFLLER